MTGIRVLSNQQVPMRDGIHLAADVYLPAGVSSAPVILSRTPYEASSDRFARPRRVFREPRVRGGGAGLSRLFPLEGELFTPWVHDGVDGYDTLEWIGKQSWCGGPVGMWGPSYMGFNEWQVAPLRHPLLKALAPQVSPSNYWRQGAWVTGASS